MATHLFIDESVQKSFVLVGVNFNASHVALGRQHTKKLLLLGQSFLHMKRESDARRKFLTQSIGDFPCNISVIESRNSSSELSATRQELLRELAELSTTDVERIVLDRTMESNRDLVTIGRSKIASADVHHVPSRQEPLLWIPDIVAWAYAKGGEFRTLVMQLNPQVLQLD